MYSIIVPTLNRAPLLVKTLEALLPTIDPAECEVIVVDNGSRDGTAGLCENVAKRYARIPLNYINDCEPGLLTGRHRGAREARGNVLVFIDDDVVVSACWMDALREVFSNSEVALAGGPSVPRFMAATPEWIGKLWTEIPGGKHLDALSLIDQGDYVKNCSPLLVFGLNFAIRRDVFVACGGFHPDCIPKSLQRYQGDGETGLALKIEARGLRCIYHPGLRVEHLIPEHRLTTSAFEQRAFYQGVCDSYTRIRSGGDLAQEPGPIKKWISQRRQKRERVVMNKAPSAESIQCLMSEARANGFAFHQHEVRNDPSLLEWVLKTDYFDYRLPSGWKLYAGDSFTACA